MPLKLPSRRKTTKKKSPRPETTKDAIAVALKPTVPPEEAAAINALIKQSAGGKDMQPLKDRRSHGDGGSTPPKGDQRRPSFMDEAATAEYEEINGLLKMMSNKGELGSVLRERRNSKNLDAFDAIPADDSTEDLPPHIKAMLRSNASPESGSASERKTLITTSPGPEDAYPVQSTAAVQRRKEAETAVANADRLSQMDDKEAGVVRTAIESSQQQAFDVTRLKGMDGLKGAAARGARAAALENVKQAASAVGGVFLTHDQHTTLKEQINLLTAANKRLQQELDDHRKHPKQEASPTGPSNVSEAAPNTASPTWQRLSQIGRSLSKHSPFGRRAGAPNTTSPAAVRFAASPSGLRFASPSGLRFTKATPSVEVGVQPTGDRAGEAIW